MEELQVGKEASQASHGHNSVRSTREDFILNFITGAENKKARTQSQTPNQIHKVAQMPRDTEEFKKYYEPSVVSIGPYYYNINGDSRLKQVQDLKPILAKQFLEWNELLSLNLKQPLQLFNDFEEQIKEIEVKKWYDEDVTKNIDEEAFTQMMFLDGCFILFFFSCIAFDIVKNLMMKKNVIGLVQQDLFLLENQLPFPVLKVLMSLSTFDDLQWSAIFYKFFVINTNSHFDVTSVFNIKGFVKDEGILHLVDLLRTNLLGIGSQKKDNKIEINVPLQKENLNIKSHLFRGVKELTAAGIHLRPKKKGSLRDINFRSYGIYGRLTLPRMTIDSTTRPMFLNLIAYEACMDKPNEFWFTSYICFLRLLSDHADDVKELRTAGILVNYLGSDEEVAKLFNEIAADLVPDVDTYKHVKWKILSYLNHKGTTMIASWVAEVFRDHFKSPWTTIAVLAAFIAIFLTSVQTYVAVFPHPDKCNESICSYLRNKTL